MLAMIPSKSLLLSFSNGHWIFPNSDPISVDMARDPDRLKLLYTSYYPICAKTCSLFLFVTTAKKLARKYLVWQSFYGMAWESPTCPIRHCRHAAHIVRSTAHIGGPASDWSLRPSGGGTGGTQLLPTPLELDLFCNAILIFSYAKLCQLLACGKS